MSLFDEVASTVEGISQNLAVVNGRMRQVREVMASMSLSERSMAKPERPKGKQKEETQLEVRKTRSTPVLPSNHKKDGHKELCTAFDGAKEQPRQLQNGVVTDRGRSPKLQPL